MAHDRTFRFGVQASTAGSADEWRDLARRIEDLGFSSLTLPDHFGDQLAPIPAMMAAADATTELKVGALVFDNDYRHPVVLAKELATVDVLSGGRVEIGLGAGWMTDDYERSGIQHDEPKVRVDRFVEGLQVIKQLLSDEPATFAGEHYTVTELDGRPKPVQRPHPPFLLGGGGKRMLTIAARHADIVGVNPNLRTGRIDATSAADAKPERFDEKLTWVRDAAGERFDDLELNALMFLVNQTDDRDGFAENVAPVFAMTPDEVSHTPLALFGNVGEMCDELEWRRERWGFSYIICQRDAVDALAPVVAKLTGT
jgi:probable F420-dependent oxidoreductase